MFDDNASRAIRLTAIPASNDIVGKRNQIIEIDIINTIITGGQDTIAVNSGGGVLRHLWQQLIM